MKELIKKARTGVVKIGMVIKDSNNNQIKVDSGSGFLVSKEGYVLTCEHVIKDLPFIHILFEKGKFKFDYFLAKCIFKDEKKDFAILKIDKNDLDNFLKPIIDAIEGILFNSESQITSIYIKRVGVDLKDEEGVSILSKRREGKNR